MKSGKNFNYDKMFMGVFQGRTEGFYRAIYKRKPELRRTVDMVKLQKGRMLDVGSGGGLMTECLPYYYPSVKVYGCDISNSAIAYAKKYGTGRVQYKTMKKRLPYPSNYFDACLCNDVLEHIPDVPYFLNEVRRVLKKDGIFFLAIPCEGQPFTIHWLFNKLGFWDNLTLKHIGHIHPEFTHTYVLELFRKHNFVFVSKKFNERLMVQAMRYIFYLIPKELLEAIVGTKKAEYYYDINVVTKNEVAEKDFFMILRIAWLKLSTLANIIYDIDTNYLTQVSFAAGKIFLLVRNDK